MKWSVAVAPVLMGLAAFGLGGCLDTASLDNDQGASGLLDGRGPSAGQPSQPSTGDGDGNVPPGDGDSNAPPGDGDDSVSPGNGDGDSGAPPGDGDDGAIPPGDGDGSAPPGDGDGSVPPGDGDDGTVAPMPELVAGTATAAGCLSYTQPQGEMCGSYFCGVNAETLDMAFSQDGVCGEDNGNLGGIDFVCEGRLVTVVGACAREVKAANFLLTNEQLRPLVQECVYKDAEIKTNVTEPCLGCFIDVADCAGTFCLIECVAGDSEACDQCRMNNNCEQPLFGCAGFPDPL